MAALESILGKIVEGRKRSLDAFRPYNEALTRQILDPVDKAASLADMLTIVQPYNMAKTILSGKSQIPEKERAFGGPFSGSKDAMWETLISPHGMGALYPTYKAGEIMGRHMYDTSPKVRKGVSLGKGALGSILRGGQKVLRGGDKVLNVLEDIAPKAVRFGTLPGALMYLLSSNPAGAGADTFDKETDSDYVMFRPEGVFTAPKGYLMQDW